MSDSRLQRWSWAPAFFTAVYLFAGPLEARATWSIVAVDPRTGEVGSAGASYTPAVWPILGIVGGRGVVVAQAAGDEAARLEAVSLLRRGLSPAEILERIGASGSNPAAGNRQFGIAAFSGGAAGFTGSACAPWAGHRGAEQVMVQGNILAGDEVVLDALAAYRSSRSADLPLADCLMAALRAGSEAGGDSRAPGSDRAMTAYLAVARPEDPTGRPSFALIVPPPGGGVNPVEVLEERFREARGSERPLYFPSFRMTLLVLTGLPLAAGLLAGLALRIRTGRGKRGAHPWRDMGISSALSILSFYLLAGIALLASWAVPVYGSYAWAVPLALGILNVPVFLIVRGIFRLLDRIRAASRLEPRF